MESVSGFWRKAWAFGRVNIGLTDSCFWDLTIKEWEALLKRARTNAETRDVYHASLMHLIYSINRGKNSPNLSIDDFKLLQSNKSEEEIADEISNQLRALSQMS